MKTFNSLLVVLVIGCGIHHRLPAAEPVEPQVLKFDDAKAVTLGVAYSPDGKWLAAACTDKLVRVWKVEDWKLTHTLKGHTGPVCHVSFAPGGVRLASASTDKTARVWNVNTGKEVDVLEGHDAEVWRVAFDPTSNTLATGDAAGIIKLWKKGKNTGTIDTIDENANGLASLVGINSRGVGGLAFSPDGKKIAAGRSLDVIQWDVREKTGEGMPRDVVKAPGRNKLQLDTGHFNLVQNVAYSPDGKLLASSSLDATVRIWDAAKKKELRVLSGHEASPIKALAFSPDGKKLASGSYGQFRGVKIWDVKSGKELQALNAGEMKGDEVGGLAFSPDGLTVAVGTEGAVKVWPLEDKKK